MPSNARGIHADDKHQETAQGGERHHGTDTENQIWQTSDKFTMQAKWLHAAQIPQTALGNQFWVNFGVKNPGLMTGAFFAGHIMTFLCGLLDLSLADDCGNY